MGNRPFQRLAHIFREHIRILDLFAVVPHRLNNGFHIPDGNGFPEQISQDFLQSARADNAGNGILHDTAVGLFQVFQKIIDLLPVEQFIQMLLDDLRKMGDDHRSGIDQGITCHFRLDFPILANPFRRDMEGRIHGVDSGNLIRIGSGRKGKEMIHENIPSRHLFSF